MKVPGITIITDIIAGFPTETEEDFQDTMNLVKKYNFPSLFINQFFPRPGTPAAKMKRIPTQDVKERTRKITDYFQSYKPYENRVGEVYSVLCTEVSHDNQYYVAHNQFYEQVLVPKRSELMGKMFTVKIVDSCKFSMTGEIVDEKSVIRPSLADALAPGKVSGVNLMSSDSNNNQMYVKSVFVLIAAAFVRLLYLLWAW